MLDDLLSADTAVRTAAEQKLNLLPPDILVETLTRGGWSGGLLACPNCTGTLEDGPLAGLALVLLRQLAPLPTQVDE